MKVIWSTWDDETMHGPLWIAEAQHAASCKIEVNDRTLTVCVLGTLPEVSAVNAADMPCVRAEVERRAAERWGKGALTRIAPRTYVWQDPPYVEYPPGGGRAVPKYLWPSLEALIEATKEAGVRMLFSKRKQLAEAAERYCAELGIKPDALNITAALDALGALRLPPEKVAEQTKRHDLKAASVGFGLATRPAGTITGDASCVRAQTPLKEFGLEPAPPDVADPQPDATVTAPERP